MTIYLKKIETRKEYGQGFKTYCHNSGIELLQYAVQKEYGIEISECDIEKQEKGKPYFTTNDNIKFSISHCNGLCVCVLSDKEVGIDCESVRDVSDAVMRRCFSPEEREYVNRSSERDVDFTRLWTLKESYVKMTGDGISSHLYRIAFDLSENKTRFKSDCSFYQLYIFKQFFVSVCCAGGEKDNIRYELTDSDIDNGNILLYNISDN